MNAVKVASMKKGKGIRDHRKRILREKILEHQFRNMFRDE